MFKPTHTFHYPAGSNCKKYFPKGIPVIKGHVYDDGTIEWYADSAGNVGGYSTEGDSFVVPLVKVSEVMINVDQLMLDLKELHQEFVTTTREADSLAKKSVRDVYDWNFYIGSGNA
jgi:hypothetical protein